MNDIRPQDLPELRAELLGHFESKRGIREWAPRTFEPASVVPCDDGTVLVCDPTSEQRRAFEVARLRRADLFFVSGPMSQLASEAAKSLPEFKVEEFDLPAYEGFMVFQEPFPHVIEERDGIVTYVTAVSWSIARNSELGASLWLSFYADLARSRSEIEALYGPMRSGMPDLFYTLDCEWSFDASHIPKEDSALHIWGRTVISAWLLMQQPLAQTVWVEPDRAARKRLRRAKQEPKPVRVIELRSPKSSGDHGEGEREYHHQWIVRGHWRNHWHPKRQVHRPVWIAPHVKGPEGAPLIGGEKVYALKR